MSAGHWRVLWLVLVLAVGYAAASHGEVGVTHPDCSLRNANYNANGGDLASKLTIPPTYTGRKLLNVTFPLIRGSTGAETKASTIFVTTGSMTEYGTFNSSWASWVNFTIGVPSGGTSHPVGTGVSSGHSGDHWLITADFENEILSTSGSTTLVLSSISWNNPSYTITGVPHYVGFDITGNNTEVIVNADEVGSNPLPCDYSASTIRTFSREDPNQPRPYNWRPQNAVHAAAAGHSGFYVRFFVTPASVPPDIAANLTDCNIVRLNWSDPGNGPNSYVINRTSPLGLNTSWTVPPYGNFSLRLFNDTIPLANTTFSYTVVGVNDSTGYGFTSSLANVTPPVVRTLGDCGLQWGGMSEEELAAEARLSVGALELVISMIFVLIGTGIGFAFIGSGPGAAAGAFGGVLVSIGFAVLPEWAIFLLAAVMAAGLVLAGLVAGVGRDVRRGSR